VNAGLMTSSYQLRSTCSANESVFQSEVGDTTYSPDSHNILKHACTTSANAVISKDIADLLNNCAIRGGDSIHHELLGGPGHDFLQQDHGVKH
jgi:hypothetical protein